MDSNVSNFIINLRKKHKLTQAEFASRLGVTYQAVSKWENNKSIPDISTLQLISKEFDVDISEILVGKKKNRKKYIIFFIILCIVVILLSIFLINKDDSFEFKTVVADNDSFIIDGVAAYSSDKSSLYISSIDIKEDNHDKYNLVECTLYEKYNNKNNKISTCENSSDKEVTLSELLKNINFYINDNSFSCNNISEHNLYIEVKALDKNKQEINYKIPLKFNDYCK